MAGVDGFPASPKMDNGGYVFIKFSSFLLIAIQWLMLIPSSPRVEAGHFPSDSETKKVFLFVAYYLPIPEIKLEPPPGPV